MILHRVAGWLSRPSPQAWGAFSLVMLWGVIGLCYWLAITTVVVNTKAANNQGGLLGLGSLLGGVAAPLSLRWLWLFEERRIGRGRARAERIAELESELGL